MLYNEGMTVFGCSARYWSLLFAVTLAGCSVDQVVYEGRPCETDEQCAGGTRCDAASKTCQRPGADAGDAGKDLQPGDKGKLPDRAPEPDQLLAPDGGCPKGKVRCGAVCADLQTNSKHCGKCNSACPPMEGASCSNGKCHCGKGPVCSSGLTCVNKICRCVAGGLCKGCCEGDVCRTSLSVTKCGAGGKKCASCVDSNSCTADACGKTGCLNKVKPGYCVINKTCYASGAKHPTSSCLACVPSSSTSSWTAAKGCVSTLAGTGSYGCTNGLASSATFYNPIGIAVDSVGRIYVAEFTNNVIRTIYKGQVSVFAGVCKKSGSADGPAQSATFKQPQDVAVDKAGSVYVVDNGNNRIRKISGGKVTTLAGGTKGFADGQGTSARFDNPQSIVVTSTGTLFVVDTSNNRIRKITSGGKVTTLAGSGKPGSTNGPLLSATFNFPHSITKDSSGNLYVGEVYWIRKISASAVTTLIKPTAGCSGLHGVQGMVPGQPGKLYIADSQSHRIVRYAAGALSTVAGKCQVKGSTDGAASLATFNFPFDLTAWGGKLYVADYLNHKIRVISLP